MSTVTTVLLTLALIPLAAIGMFFLFIAFMYLKIRRDPSWQTGFVANKNLAKARDRLGQIAACETLHAARKIASNALEETSETIPRFSRKDFT